MAIARSSVRKFCLPVAVLMLCFLNLTTDLGSSNVASSTPTGTPTGIPTGNTTSSRPSLPIFSACLLIKDDNAILNEWIAYHFHLWNLRYLIVAVDPTSKTSPQPFLERWAKVFSSHNFQFRLWQDADYMPETFLQGDHSQAGSARDKNRIRKHSNRTFTADELQSIVNHRFRQREFYRNCLKHLHDEQQKQKLDDNNEHNNHIIQWIAHIDTDEYISLNPWLLEEFQQQNKSLSSSSSSTNSTALVQERRERVLAVKPTAGALLELLMDDQRRQTNPPACLGLPRILFGGVERGEGFQLQVAGSASTSIPPSNNNIDGSTGTSTSSSSSSSPWNVTLLESIRWKYHAPMVTAGPLNGLPKALLDWSVYGDASSSSPTNITQQQQQQQRQRQRDALLTKPFSIHIPHRHACPRKVSMMDDDGGPPPLLAIHHYLGSAERYLWRDDPRRSLETYIVKANQTEGPIGNQMDGWLEEFVKVQGVDKVSQVLKDYLLEVI